MTPSGATIATYLRKGIELGLLSLEDARSWADAHILKENDPAYEFIEISLSKTPAEMLSALGAVHGEVDKASVGRWLLAKVSELDTASVEDLVAAVQRAMQVCRHCELDDSLYYAFDGLDDSLFLATDGICGSVAECHSDFLELLRQHAHRAPALSEA